MSFLFEPVFTILKLFFIEKLLFSLIVRKQTLQGTVEIIKRVVRRESAIIFIALAKT